MAKRLYKTVFVYYNIHTRRLLTLELCSERLFLCGYYSTNSKMLSVRSWCIENNIGVRRFKIIHCSSLCVHIVSIYKLRTLRYVFDTKKNLQY